MTSIYTSAFEGCGGLTSVVLPNGVTSIGNGAFKDCTGLTSISIPNTVTSVGAYAFMGCGKLTEIPIPNGLNKICYSTFYGCASLTSVDIPASVTSIDYCAFTDCASLASVTIPASVTSMGGSLFKGCTSLTSVTIPDSVTSSDWNMFSGCTNLVSVTLSRNLTSIGGYMFNDCTSLVSLDIPSAVTTIGSSAFSGCSSLISLDIPDGVTAIGDSAFIGCFSLEEITIPNTVTSIGGCAFQGCRALTSVTLPQGLTEIPFALFSECYNLASVAVPDGVTSIGYKAFYQCSPVIYIHRNTVAAELLCKEGLAIWEPESDYSIRFLYEGDDMTGVEIVAADTNITDITIPDYITRIGTFAFHRCSGLTGTFILPDNITSIGYQAFSGCTGLTAIIIPDGLTGVDEGAFYGCSAILYARLDSEGAKAVSKADFDFRIPGANYSLKYAFDYDGAVNGLNVTGADAGAVNVSIVDGATGIAHYAFMRHPALTSITLPPSIKSITNEAFQYCRTLEYVFMSEGVTYIGSNAFNDCRKLKSITIPDSVTDIVGGAFDGCSSLTSITIPRNATFVGYQAFRGCSKLEKILVYSPTITFASSQIAGISPKPTIYCYQNSAMSGWAADNGYPLVYLDDLDMDSVRTLSVQDDFRLGCGQRQAIGVNVFPSSDVSNIVWSSSAPDIVNVEYGGTAVAIAPGMAEITATLGSLSASVRITAYIQAADFTLNIEEALLFANETLQIVPAAVPSEAEVSYTFASSDSTVATVSLTGMVTAMRPGNAVITVASDNGIKRTIPVRVVAPVTAIELEPIPYIPVGQETQMTANVTMFDDHCVNQFVVFASSDSSVATVDPETGVVSALAHGQAEITATAKSGVSASLTVAVHAVEVIPAVEASCTEGGMTGGARCTVCGNILITPEATETLGHDWQAAVYTWNGYEKVAASCVCSRNSAHKLTEEVGTSAQIISPDENHAGQAIYTSAEFENEAFSVQTVTVTIPPLNSMNVLRLPAALQAIQQEAFAGAGFEAVIIDGNCEFIDSRAFADCVNLRYVRIPASVTGIADDAFEGCDQVVIDRIIK